MKLFTNRLPGRGALKAALYGSLGLMALAFSAPLQAQTTNPSPYCSTSHANMSGSGCQGSWGFYLTKIELNGASGSYSCDNSTVYRYYNSSNFTTLKRGVTYTLKLTTASTVYATSSAGWIDFDGNESFAEANEYLGSQLGSNNPTLNYTFTVPANATPGKTRMRIRCDYYSAMTGTMYCGGSAQNYGETIDLDVEIEQVNYPDLSIGSLLKPLSVCGDNNDSVVVNLHNFGNAGMSNIPVTCEITGTMGGTPVNQTINTTVTATLGVLQTYRLTFPTPVNTNNFGTLNFKIYHSEGTDGDHTNDTLKVAKTFYGTPNNPTVSDVDRCGVGTVTLTSTPANGQDNVRWYSAASGGTMIGAGSSITSPFYYSSTTVYAQSSRNGATGSFAPSTSGNTVYWGGTTNAQGGMMNVTPKKTMMIDNIQIRKFYGYTANYKVFVRVGGYNGFETNQGAWTLVGQRTGVTGGSGTMIPINIGGFILEEGVTYGIYVQCIGDDFWIRYNPTPPFNEENDDMMMQNGIYLYGDFANTVFNYCIDVQWDYTTMCLGNRVPVNVTVKPVPSGTTFSKGATYNGTYNSGTSADPDITASGDVIEYDLAPPTGYQNTTYGTNWSVSNVAIKSKTGADLPSGNYSFTNPGAANGKLNINPPAGYTDSLMTVAFTVTAQGCDTTIYRSFFIAPRPVSVFNAGNVCEGAGLQFANNSTLSSGSVVYTWNFGDGSPSSALINPKHTYPGPGTYTVTLNAVSNYGYSSSSQQNITVFENPTAEFSYTNMCEGAAIPFSDASVIPAGSPSYEWNFGDGSAMGTGATQSHQYTTPGVYEVTMKVTANGCSDEITNYVTYAPRAVPNFTHSVPGCNSIDINFNNTSSLSSGTMGFSWDFGDNTYGTTENPSHEYFLSGSITATLTVTTDQGCVDQVNKTFSLIAAPHADFTSGALCNNTSVPFTNTTVEPSSGVTTYTWTFGDGSTDNSKDATKQFPSIGSYTVKLEAFSDNGCKDEKMLTVVLEETPAAQFYANAVCEGNETVFNNASSGNNGNLNYSWDFGGATSTAVNPTHTFATGTHNVTLTVTTPNNGCMATVSRQIEVNANPVVNSMVVESGQKGDGSYVLVADVTPANAIYTVFWGDGGRTLGTATGGQIAETYTYLVDSKYSPCLRVENKGCIINSCGDIDVIRTGLETLSDGSLNVYPNPGKGVFQVELKGMATDNITIEIFAANGQQVQANVAIEGDAAQVDMTGAAAGVYLVKVNTASGVYTSRISVVK